MRFTTVIGLVLGIALAGGVPATARAAEEGTGTAAATRALPVLLIKGEVVSLDTNDPTATLVKVKDRYGFETPIYVTPEAKVTQGGQAVALASLTTGTTVDVEYNFDINTAKRHAVSVKVAQAAAPAATAAVPAAAPAPAAPAAALAPADPAPAAPAPSTAPADATPSSQEAAPAAQQ